MGRVRICLDEKVRGGGERALYYVHRGRIENGKSTDRDMEGF